MARKINNGFRRADGRTPSTGYDLGLNPWSG
jgi:hypothetical protein